MWQVEVSHKSEMAGPFNRGDTIINKHLSNSEDPDEMWQYEVFHKGLHCLLLFCYC